MCVFLSWRSNEAHDGAGERGSKSEHSPGQHPETVRGREEQDSRQTGQWEAGAAATEEERGWRSLLFKNKLNLRNIKSVSQESAEHL